MIDPLTALAGIQAAVALIKKVSKTVDDVSSLGPVLGKYFDAKSVASKAAVEAKGSGKKSSMGAAIEIEMALHQAEQFERELQMLFMTTGKIDVWNKIKARQAEMDADDAQEIRLFNAQERQRKQKEAELNEWAVIISACAFVLFIMFVGGYELHQFCQTGNRCGR